MSESAKVLPRIRNLLEGKTVLDLGCGMTKVVPWATGVDDCSENKQATPDIKAPVNGGTRLGGPYDVVFSSHLLEHLSPPISWTLEGWAHLVKPGGSLILYLPDERYYVYDPLKPKSRNPHHLHYLTLDTFLWHIEQIPSLELLWAELEDVRTGHYSFLIIARKK